MTRLKRSAVLFGSRRVRKSKPASSKKQADDLTGDLEDEDWEYQNDLLTPDKVVIADETNAYQLFGDVIFTAPQEDLLEGTVLDSSCPDCLCSLHFGRVLSGVGLQTSQYDGSRGLSHEQRSHWLSEGG